METWNQPSGYAIVRVEQIKASLWDHFTANATPISAMFIALVAAITFIVLNRIWRTQKLRIAEIEAETERLKIHTSESVERAANQLRESWLQAKYVNGSADANSIHDDDDGSDGIY